uniref:SGNH hydrolase-type esterase domain-containing protein n=1 Tax=Esox lucius TaxID=8010 RepID=A0AAY5KQ92_ESOLU
MPYHCNCCSSNTEENVRLKLKIAELEARLLTQMPGKDYASVEIEKSASVPPGRNNSFVSPPAQLLQPGNNFLLVTGKKCRRPVKPESLLKPTETLNRFSPLESESRPEPSSEGNDRQACSTGGLEKLKTLVIGESITHSIRLKNQPAIVHCLPGGRATDVAANLGLVLAKSKTGKYREYRDIVIHVGTNDVRMKQSEVTKQNIASACKLARKMCRHRVIVSGPLPARGGDELYSRLAQLNRWLKTEFCPLQEVEFVDNWPSFWDSPRNRARPDLLRSDGLHPSWSGALLLSRNIPPIALT